jgi:hypothetical protein
VYRRTVTRLEALGTLQGRIPEWTREPFVRGGLVAWRDRPDGHLLLGVIHAHAGEDTEVVAFADGTTRYVPWQELEPFSVAKVPPEQVFEDLVPSLVSVFLGESDLSARDRTRYAWVADALAWDALLLLAVLGARRSRVPLRASLFVLAVVVGTMLVLVAVPGAPGNADRHRESQTVPLLLVLASGLVASPWPLRAGVKLTRATTRPASEPTPASSRMRSAR